MNKKTANKLAQAIKQIESAIWLCNSEAESMSIREIYWQIIDLAKDEDYEIYEDSRGYHAKRIPA